MGGNVIEMIVVVLRVVEVVEAVEVLWIDAAEVVLVVVADVVVDVDDWVVTIAWVVVDTVACDVTSTWVVGIGVVVLETVEVVWTSAAEVVCIGDVDTVSGIVEVIIFPGRVAVNVVAADEDDASVNVLVSNCVVLIGKVESVESVGTVSSGGDVEIVGTFMLTKLAITRKWKSNHSLRPI